MAINLRVYATALALALVPLLTPACGGDRADGGAAEGVSGQVSVDGSSTVFPITEAVAEEFRTAGGQNVRLSVGVSGTGGGFKRFCAGETDISNASRPISDSEREACAQAGVEFLELPVASDGLSVVTNPQTNWVDCLTVEELRKIWEPGSTVRNWSDIRSGFPNQPITLYGPGTDSGTFDYFTEAILGETGASRSDYTASEDDNVLVQGVTGDPRSLGYFGYAYYEQNEARLKVLGIDNGGGCVQPNPRTIESGEYAPLSRPIFIYVKKASLERPAVAEFIRFYQEVAPELVREVGYIPLGAQQYQQNLEQLTQTGEGTA